MTSTVDDAFRLVDEIKGMIADGDRKHDGYMWGVHDYEHLRYFAYERDVETLSIIKRDILPLQKEFNPAKIGLAVSILREHGFDNIAERVTRKAIIEWLRITEALVQSSMENDDRVPASEDDSAGVMLMAFTDPEMVDEVISVIWDRGVLPPDMMRGVVLERRKSVPTLVTGSL